VNVTNSGPLIYPPMNLFLSEETYIENSTEKTQGRLENLFQEKVPEMDLTQCSFLKSIMLQFNVISKIKYIPFLLL
jgi:hypothetical protein